jgi:hypothetical protein
MNQTNFVNLRNVLAYLYPDEPKIRRIIDDSTLDSAQIAFNFNTSAINNWHSILLEVQKLGRIDDLLSIVENEYGSYNKELHDACDTYRQSMNQNNRANLQNDQYSGQDHSAHNIPPAKILRNCLEDAFDDESLRSFCYDYFGSVAKKLQPTDRFDSTVTQIINYCEQRGKVDYLWQSIKHERGVSYETYFSLWQKRIGR